MTKYLHFLTRFDKRGAYVDLQLTPAELAAIGHVTAQFAFLEFLMLRESKGLAKHLREPLPDEASEISFKKRRKAWKILAKKALADLDEEWSRTEKLIAEVDAVAEQRHKIVHDVIRHEPHDKKRLKAFPRETIDSFGWPLDTAAIEALARRIARINHDLLSIHADPKPAHGALPRIPGKPIRSSRRPR